MALPEWDDEREPRGVRAALGADPGRTVTRWGLAGAMVVTAAALVTLFVPDRDDDRLETAATTVTVTSTPRVTATSEAPLAAYDNVATTPDGSAAGASPAATGSTTTVGADGSATPLPAPAAPDALASTATSASATTAAAPAPSTRPPSTATTATRPPSTPPPSPTTAPAPTTAPPTAAPPSDSGCWNLVLQDDFNGSSLNTAAWSPYNSSGNAGFGLRRPSAITVANGLLTITARMENGTLVSGGMSHRHSQTYGRYEVRVRTDRDPSEATSGVVLTWPASGVHPRDGENDFYETTGTPGDRHEFYTFIHKPFGAAHEQDYTVHPVSAADWHTIVMEWRPNQIRIHRDGVLVKTLDETGADLIPDTAHYATIQLDAKKSSVAGPVSMQVDYIKVYSAC